MKFRDSISLLLSAGLILQSSPALAVYQMPSTGDSACDAQVVKPCQDQMDNVKSKCGDGSANGLGANGAGVQLSGASGECLEAEKTALSECKNAKKQCSKNQACAKDPSISRECEQDFASATSELQRAMGSNTTAMNAGHAVDSQTGLSGDNPQPDGSADLAKPNADGTKPGSEDSAKPSAVAGNDPNGGTATPGGGSTANPGGGSKGGGGGMGAIGSMLGPMAMLAALAMKKNDNQTPQVTANGYASPDGVIGTNGQPNCSANMAYMYSICNPTIAAACMQNINTMLTSQVCTQFSARYCNLGYTPPQIYSPYPYPLYAGEQIGNQIVTTPSPTYVTNAVGEGTGSAYCLRALQINFCQSASNLSCPSCMQLKQLMSQACVNNPGACAATSSATIYQAQMNACPNADPLQSIPTGSTQVAGAGNVPLGSGSTAMPVYGNVPLTAKGLKTASVGGSPQREIASEFGRSLWSTASEPTTVRCNNGQLNHCL